MEQEISRSWKLSTSELWASLLVQFWPLNIFWLLIFFHFEIVIFKMSFILFYNNNNMEDYATNNYHLGELYFIPDPYR